MAVAREDGYGFDYATTGKTTLSVNHAHTTGNCVVAIVFCANQDSTLAVNGVTYNSSAMTKRGEVKQNVTVASVWYKINPSTGTRAIEATLSTAANVHFGLYTRSFSGVNTTTPISDSTEAGGITSAWTCELDTGSNGLMLMAGNWNLPAVTFTSGAGSTIIRNSTFNPGTGRVIFTEKTASGTTGSIGGYTSTQVDRPIFAWALNDSSASTGVDILSFQALLFG